MPKSSVIRHSPIRILKAAPPRRRKIRQTIRLPPRARPTGPPIRQLWLVVLGDSW